MGVMWIDVDTVMELLYSRKQSFKLLKSYSNRNLLSIQIKPQLSPSNRSFVLSKQKPHSLIQEKITFESKGMFFE